MSGIRAVISMILACFFVSGAAAQSWPETTGPYKIVMEMDPSLPDHTVYRPDNLAAVEGKLPILAFGNGGCANAGNAFENYLAEVASHGFLVVADGTIDLSPLPAGRPPKTPEKPDYTRSGQNRKQSTTSQLYETMDWAAAQSADQKGKYYGKLNPGLIAVMGQSCGGLQALEAASDPRVKAVVILNSGIIRDKSIVPPGAVLPAGPESLSKLHTPVIYIIGGPTDIAYANAEEDFAEITTVPVFKANLPGVGHDGTLWQPHGGKFAEVITAWLWWQLRNDNKAAMEFTGINCGLCTDSAWNVERKNMK